MPIPQDLILQDLILQDLIPQDLIPQGLIPQGLIPQGYFHSLNNLLVRRLCLILQARLILLLYIEQLILSRLQFRM
ncbi:hypothetical protein RIVM261_002720 [Rivularia sp. IAM M-261]|nr:hypothetical protein RIVM261_002720 [Rivularia sp. IAM M-261]